MVVIHSHQVGSPVRVHITDGEVVHRPSGVNRHGFVKAAVALTAKVMKGRRTEIADDEIEVTISIEIAGSQFRWERHSPRQRNLPPVAKRTVGPAEPHENPFPWIADRFRPSVIRIDDVRDPIIVEIREGAGQVEPRPGIERG